MDTTIKCLKYKLQNGNNNTLDTVVNVFGRQIHDGECHFTLIWIQQP